MFKASPRVCLFCQHHLFRRDCLVSSSSQWQTTRSMAQLERRRPSRMTLSPKVSPHRIEQRSQERKDKEPFGGMNRATIDLRKLHRKPTTMKRRPEKAGPRSHARRTAPKGKAPQKERETFHALKMQQSLSTVPYRERGNIKTRIAMYEGFEDFPLLPVVTQAIGQQILSDLEDLSPTPIQQVAIPALLGVGTKGPKKIAAIQDAGTMEQFLLAAETGSGKTLAYVLPILDAIKRAEVIEADEQARTGIGGEKLGDQNLLDPTFDGPDPYTGRPRAIVLVPTSELVFQVGNVIKALSHTVKVRSALISSAYSAKVIRNRLFSPSGIDVLVTTPHLLASISSSEPNILSRVTHLVVDEADSLFDRSFAPSTSTVVDKSTPSLKQLILCSATIPRNLDSYLKQRFPDMHRLVTPHLHAIPRRVQLGVVDIDKQPYVGNRLLACAETIWSIGKTANENRAAGVEQDSITRLLVFVNERASTVEVASYLNSKGIDAIALNRDSTEQRQTDALADFTAPPKKQSNAEDRSAKAESTLQPPFPSHVRQQTKRHLSNTKVMVSTDLGSRGIDTLAVRHVILHDVPHSSADFIHRLGRTGRMGRRGRGTVLMGKNDRKDIIREVREGMFKGQALI